MKKIHKDKILNISNTDVFDNTFVFEYLLYSPPTPLQERGGRQQNTLPQPLSKRGEEDNLSEEISVQADHRLPYNKDLQERRKELKKNLTYYEKRIWKELLSVIQEKYGIRILQQRIIGNFIVDFYIASLDLVIEIDGESHFSEPGEQYDIERTEILQGYGLKVLRFTNTQIKEDIQGIGGILENYIHGANSPLWGEREKENIYNFCEIGEEINNTPIKREGLNSPLLERGWGRVGNHVQVIYLRDELKKYKNEEILQKVQEKPAMYSEVYSPKDELEIFTQLFESAIAENKKIHIIGVTLGEEIQILEKYYTELGFMREDINCFEVDFSVPLVTVSCHIENLIWRGSDYKAQREAIFFCPPIRESGQNKAIFKGITRGVIAGIEIGEMTPEKEVFLSDCIREEKILPLHMGKVLKYNLEEIGFEGEQGELKVKY